MYRTSARNRSADERNNFRRHIGPQREVGAAARAALGRRVAVVPQGVWHTDRMNEVEGLKGRANLPLPCLAVPGGA